jgi:hypothetical protein
MNVAREYYEAARSETVSQLQKTIRMVSKMYIYRLLAFVLIFGSFFIFRHNTLLAGILSASFTILFIGLVKKNIHLERKKRRQTIRLFLIEKELKALQFDFLDFPEGTAFNDVGHPYSYDLDLFGKGSVYQYINRTTTSGGSTYLANAFKYPEKDAGAILARQQSVKEMARLREWRLNFLTEGNLIDVSDLEKTILTDSSPELYLISKPGFLKVATILLPVITFVSLILFILGGTHVWLLLTAVVNSLVLFNFRHEVQRFYALFGNKTHIISKYLRILTMAENQPFESGELAGLHYRLTEPVKSTVAIARLNSIMAQLDYRANLLIGITLNVLLLWDLRCILKLSKWHQDNHQKLKDWMEVIGIFDALISMGIFADHNSGYAFPSPSEGEFRLDLKEMGHPLLKPDKRIDNDFAIDGCPRVAIITGANMAGKSTFLRSVGVNMVLAGMGLPVCAASMEFTPAGIFTSMRTTDSLLKEESYFLAELKRIAAIMQQLRSGETILVILDEMLKGTNSEDKLKGSQQLVRELVQTKAVTIIATHDVKLTGIEQEIPRHVKNYCFEIGHEGDEMIFDYKLRLGVTRTMNATLLMKKLGIIK